MKRNQYILAGLIAASLLVAGTASAFDTSTNRLTFSARFGLNIKAKFSSAAPLAIPAITRQTPINGNAYSYDDGYIYPDISGSGDGLTWYAGYDNSASQVNDAAHTILLSRATGAATLQAPSMDDNPSLGAELAYRRELGEHGKWSYGFDAAINYLTIGMSSGSDYLIQGARQTDAFGYEPGTTPPGATPSSPYQGTAAGPGFLVNLQPDSSITSPAVVGTASGSRRLDADLWGIRLGPCLEYRFSEKLSLGLSGGLAVGWLRNSASWNEVLRFSGGGSLSDSGGGNHDDILWGGYVAANLEYRLSERWSAVAGVQYQNLGDYSHNFGTRKVELDLSKAIFITIGVGYSF